MVLRDATPHDLPRVKELFRQYSAEYDEGHCFSALETELARLPSPYEPPTGRLIVAEHEGEIRGTAALKRLESIPGACELKRVYLNPDTRGKGFGRLIVEHMMGLAVADGYTWMYLDTMRQMTAAIALYETLNFEFIEAYENEPIDFLVYMRKNLR